MEMLKIISEVKSSIIALVLLGLAELLALDASGTYLRLTVPDVGLFFLAATVLVAALSIAIIGWATVKLRLRYNELLTSGIKAGMLVGFAAGIGISIFILAFGALGMSVAKLVPQQGLLRLGTAYYLVCFCVVLLYTLVGGFVGAIAGAVLEPAKEPALHIKKARVAKK